MYTFIFHRYPTLHIMLITLTYAHLCEFIQASLYTTPYILSANTLTLYMYIINICIYIYIVYVHINSNLFVHIYYKCVGIFTCVCLYI